MEVDYDAEEESLLVATAKAWGTAAPSLTLPTGDAVEVRERSLHWCMPCCLRTHYSPTTICA